MLIDKLLAFPLVVAPPKRCKNLLPKPGEGSLEALIFSLAILRKKRSDKADDDEEGVDPEDAQTELFQLSMQLSRAENGNFMEKMKEDSR